MCLISMNRTYYTYIISNPNRTVLYTGVTNNIARRLIEHYLNRGNEKTFAGRYFCYYLLYVSEFKYVNDAIWFEKEIKRQSRKWKIDLIKEINPTMKSLNHMILGVWPPSASIIEEVTGKKNQDSTKVE